MERAHLRETGNWGSFHCSSFTVSPKTSHLAALSLSFSKQKMEKNLLTLASPALGCVCVCVCVCVCEGNNLCHLEFYKIPKGNYVANDSEMKGIP